jgi:hypothetical protein
MFRIDDSICKVSLFEKGWTRLAQIPFFQPNPPSRFFSFGFLFYFFLFFIFYFFVEVCFLFVVVVWQEVHIDVGEFRDHTEDDLVFRF